MYFNMPVDLKYNLINKRFDFGVPLEDIFAQGDIHPRLKFIFQYAFELYLDSHLNIEDILNEQWCLKECLDLKKSIIYDKKPGRPMCKPIGAYFWLIRHFLGLLPIPLLSNTTSTHKYPWQELSRKCRDLLRSKCHGSDKTNFLNYFLSRSLNNLPEEHILLLKTVIIFIREVSKKKLCKRTFQCLIRYYCDAIFTRPFMPGYHTSDNVMLPLMVYLVTKGYVIIKYLKRDYIPSFSNINSYVAFGIEKSGAVNPFTQSNQQHPHFLYINKSLPSSVTVKYLKDVECQTDSNSEERSNRLYQSSVDTMTHEEVVKSIRSNIIPEDVNLSDISNYKEQINLKSVNSPSKLRKLTSFVSSLNDINEDEENGNKYQNQNYCVGKKNQNITDVEEFDETKYYSAYNEYNTFNSTLKNDQNLKWNDVVEEIQRTVKRVESYNYENENYSTPLEYRSASSSSIESTFSSGSVETSYASCSISSVNIINKESEQKETSNKKQKNKLKLNTYQSFYGSEEELYCFGNTDDNWEDEETSSNFSTKTFKINFSFFKSISPSLKRSGKVLRRITTRSIKYKRFKSAPS